MHIRGDPFWQYQEKECKRMPMHTTMTIRPNKSLRRQNPIDLLLLFTMNHQSTHIYNMLIEKRE